MGLGEGLLLLFLVRGRETCIEGEYSCFPVLVMSLVGEGGSGDRHVANAGDAVKVRGDGMPFGGRYDGEVECMLVKSIARECDDF